LEFGSSASARSSAWRAASNRPLIERDLRPRDVKLGGVGIDRQRRVQLCARVHRVVLLDEEPRRLELRGPEARVEPAGARIERVHQERELAGVAVPARVLRSAPADPQQVFGVW
jgi:hypothetical protein